MFKLIQQYLQQTNLCAVHLMVRPLGNGLQVILSNEFGNHQPSEAAILAALSSPLVLTGTLEQIQDDFASHCQAYTGSVAAMVLSANTAQVIEGHAVAVTTAEDTVTDTPTDRDINDDNSAM